MTQGTHTGLRNNLEGGTGQEAGGGLKGQGRGDTCAPVVTSC